MKKALLLIVLLAGLSTLTYAQESTTYRSTLEKMLIASGSEGTFKTVSNQMILMFKSTQPQVPESFWIEMETEMNKTTFKELLDLLVPVYQKHLTEADLKAMTAFYESPVGKKFATTLPVITQESMAAGQIWGKKVGENVVKKLKEKGLLTQ
ncbi:MAG: DUF2059 domain-containing protein [Bacteroidota bacterium]